jgi:hypothetical protein
VSRVAQLALNDTARSFAERLLARHPEWEPFVAAYTRVAPADATAPGSLSLEVPSPHDASMALWATVEDGEALVALGDFAAEQVFDWEDGERDAAIAAILDFVDDLATGAVVGAWRRHRFLWRTWETCEFRRAAEAAADRRVVRIWAWPAPAPGAQPSP